MSDFLARRLAEEKYENSVLRKRMEDRVGEITTLRQQLEASEARCAELEDIQSDAEEMAAFVYGGGVTGYKTAEGYILRKQAEAVENCVKANKTIYLTDYAGRMIGHCNDYAQRLRQQANEAEASHD